MATIELPQDFKEFLSLLHSRGVEYLLVGGYAVAYHGYPRTTGDMDVWVSTHPNNAAKLVEVLRAFGFGAPELQPTAFTAPDQVIRMGVPPLRIEILTGISGVRFPDCYARRVRVPLDDFEISLIDAADLRANKRAAGRHKDLDDLDHLRE